MKLFRVGIYNIKVGRFSFISSKLFRVGTIQVGRYFHTFTRLKRIVSLRDPAVHVEVQVDGVEEAEE